MKKKNYQDDERGVFEAAREAAVNRTGHSSCEGSHGQCHGMSKAESTRVIVLKFLEAFLLSEQEPNIEEIMESISKETGMDLDAIDELLEVSLRKQGARFFISCMALMNSSHTFS